MAQNLTATALGVHTAAMGGAPGRAVHPDEMSQSSGISWKTGFTTDANRRLYMPAINFNKKLQRNMRYFGNFHCHRCKSNWQSANAFQRHYQKCKGCRRRTYPNKLKPLERGPARDGEGMPPPPHNRELCQRCKKLGRSCEDEPIGTDSGVNDLDAVDEQHDENPERHF